MRAWTVIAAAVLGLALTACHDGGSESAPDTGGLTQQQYTVAVNAARHEVENQDATITSATALVKKNSGKNTPSNTGLECSSDQVLRIRLIGTFPHTASTGTPGGGDSTVPELDLKADAVTGDVCLIGAGTSKRPESEQGATVLQLGD